MPNLSTISDTRKITYQERAQFYDVEYVTDVDQHFLQSLVSSDVYSILEVPCGSGRNVSWLAETGCFVTQVDLEKSMVDKVKEKIKQANRQDRMLAIVSDMRDMNLEREFDLVLVPQEAFQLLANEHDAIKALLSFRKHLSMDGTIMIDLATFSHKSKSHIGPSYYDPSFPNGELIREWTRQLPNGKSLTRSRIQHDLPSSLIVEFFYEIEGNNQKETYVTNMLLRKYDFDHFRSLCKETALEVTEVYGDYNRASYTTDSERMILLLKKKLMLRGVSL
ncbi:class I SAM-dependent methyltransferase [Lihuaxuella thermophila]|uniref:Methyltransferase domain-containing protein n=1 Tax=Lihuaxuella thermophila TaxID=1173111 RepID=A0A1H8CL05_9BACL|nr:class I SAM-dependent methyltransferase [Lihuaxuella thermophila]SEM94767.1 Methyltransferase domain-containing protein [Lihuaxuella thermophila]